MKGLIKNQKLLFISLIGIVIVSLSLMTTFAYQTLNVNIKEGSSDKLSVKAGVLDVSFTTTNRININNMPLLSSYETASYMEFTVDNSNSTEDVKYKLLLNSLKYSKELITEDFKYTIVKVVDEVESVISNGDFSDLSDNQYGFITNYGNYIYINKGEKQKIRIYLWLKETDKNQNYLENTNFKGIIEINSYFAKDVKDKSISKFVVYGNTLLEDTNGVNLRFLGSLVSDESDKNFGKYKINITAKSNNLFRTEESFVKENNNWIYQNIYLTKGSYRINYNSDNFKYIMVKDSNDNVVVDKILYTELFNIASDGEYKVYIGDDSYSFDFVQTPSFYLASLVSFDKEYDFSNYEPYTEPITYTLYLESPLKCINEICDSLDFVNNRIIRRIDSIKLKSNSNWVLDQSNGFDTYVTDIGINSNAFISNYFTYSNNIGVNNFMVNNNKIRIIFSDKDKSKLDNFKSWLDNNDVYVYYVLGNDTYASINSINLTRFIDKNIIVSDDNNTIGKVIIEYNN